MKRKKFLALVALGILTYTVWPTPTQQTILHAYSDNAFGMWGLTLYKGGQFVIYLPTSQASGLFKVSGDTIQLRYDKTENGLPAAYFINREKLRIDELELVAGKWIRSEPNNWADLAFDSTRYYAR